MKYTELKQRYISCEKCGGVNDLYEYVDQANHRSDLISIPVGVLKCNCKSCGVTLIPLK